MASDVKFITSAHGRDQWPPGDRPEIAFVGRSNVGKSSCLNTLTGRSGMARVSKTPGRTQAINFFELRHGGLDLRFADLPGYGFAKVPKSVKKTWTKMIGEYIERRQTLVLAVVLVDMRRDPTDLDINMLDWLSDAERPGLLALTKVDRISKNQRLHRQSLICKGLEVPREASLVFSSIDGTGKSELWSRIVEAVEGF